MLTRNSMFALMYLYEHGLRSEATFSLGRCVGSGCLLIRFILALTAAAGSFELVAAATCRFNEIKANRFSLDKQQCCMRSFACSAVQVTRHHLIQPRWLDC